MRFSSGSNGKNRPREVPRTAVHKAKVPSPSTQAPGVHGQLYLQTTSSDGLHYPRVQERQGRTNSTVQVDGSCEQKCGP